MTNDLAHMCLFYARSHFTNKKTEVQKGTMICLRLSNGEGFLLPRLMHFPTGMTLSWSTCLRMNPRSSPTNIAPEPQDIARVLSSQANRKRKGIYQEGIGELPELMGRLDNQAQRIEMMDGIRDLDVTRILSSVLVFHSLCVSFPPQSWSGGCSSFQPSEFSAVPLVRPKLSASALDRILSLP